MLIYPYR